MLYARTRARNRPPQNFSAGKIFWKIAENLLTILS